MKASDIKGVKPSQLVKIVMACIKANLACFIWGPPGVGKSAIVAQIAKTLGLLFVDLRANLLGPTDLRGIPVADLQNRIVNWFPPGFLPSDPASKGILFLDELPTAPPAVQAMFYQLILDHRCGEYTLPPGWVIIAAGNRSEDRALVHEMPSPLKNRFVHLELRPDIDDFCHHAMERGFAPEVVGYIRWRGVDTLFHFDPTVYKRAFPTPRSWEFVSRLLLSGAEASLENTPLFAGTVGEGPAVEFVAFCDLYGKLPSAEDILWGGKLDIAPPDKSHADRLYAFSVSLASAAARAPEGKEVEVARRFCKYLLTRMPEEYGVAAVADFVATEAYKKVRPAFVKTQEGRDLVQKYGKLLLG